MAKLIAWEDLRYHLWRAGPYIVFYNGNCDGFNKELVTHLNALATLNPKLHVFEIDWKDKKIFTPTVSDDLMNTVCLHSRGVMIDHSFFPATDKIDEIFRKSVDLYNTNIDKCAKNVGTRRNKSPKSELTNTRVESSERSERVNFWRMKSILNKKIKFNRDESVTPITFKSYSKSINNKKELPEIQKSENEFPITPKNIKTSEIEESAIISLRSDLKNVEIHGSFSGISNKDKTFYLPKKIQRQRENLKRISCLSKLDTLNEQQLIEKNPNNSIFTNTVNSNEIKVLDLSLKRKPKHKTMSKLILYSNIRHQKLLPKTTM